MTFDLADVVPWGRTLGEYRQMFALQEGFIWDAMGSVEELGRLRMGAMEAFLDDFAAASGSGRYVAGELPALPFQSGSFDLALCSHLLFLYSGQRDEAFHLAAVDDLCRLVPEVRIFPLVELGGRPSRHVPAVADQMRAVGFEVTIERVPYEFQRGGNQMMRIRR